jgi:hypothetical protein
MKIFFFLEIGKSPENSQIIKGLGKMTEVRTVQNDTKNVCHFATGVSFCNILTNVMKIPDGC